MKIRYPKGNLIRRDLTREYPVVEKGEGLYLYDQEGNKYIDAAGGAMVMSVGHGNLNVIKRIQAQLEKISYVNGMQFTSEPTEQLASLLARWGKTINMDCAFFLSSGSEAVEAAIKLARQIQVERGQLDRHKIIARTPGYHGNTLFALSASGRPHYKKMFGPLLHPILTIPTPYEYRSQVADYRKDGADYYAQFLEHTIKKNGPDSVAAFIAEPISGSSTGGSVPPPKYFEKVQQICRQYGVLIIADEILCGAGRTGKFFASEHVGLKPDITVLGKGLNGGYAPLSAVLTSSSHLKLIQQGSGKYCHAQTYAMNPIACAAGLAVLEEIDSQKLVHNTASMGDFLHQQLDQQIASHPCVGFITGKGLLAGIEFVEDKKTKKPFDRALRKAETFTEFCFEKGLILWPNVGHADGVHGDLVMIAPPLNSQKEDILSIVEALKTAIERFF